MKYIYIILILLLFSSVGYSATLFETSWNHSTGTDCEAFSDGGRFDSWTNCTDCAADYNPDPGVYCIAENPAPISVVSGGVGGGNKLVLEIYSPGGTDGYSLCEVGGLGYNSDSNTYWRVYVYVHDTDGFDYGYGHCIENNGVGTTAICYFGVLAVDNTNFTPYFYLGTEDIANGNDDAYWKSTTDLSVNTWYRIEGRVEWLSHDVNGENKYHIKIYNLAGTLLLDDSDFINWLGTSTPLDTFLATGTFQINGTIQDWKIGWNGPGTGTGTGAALEISDLKVADDDWIGAVSPSSSITFDGMTPVGMTYP